MCRAAAPQGVCNIAGRSQKEEQGEGVLSNSSRCNQGSTAGTFRSPGHNGISRGTATCAVCVGAAVGTPADLAAAREQGEVHDVL
jgi:hypothetical protein